MEDSPCVQYEHLLIKVTHSIEKLKKRTNLDSWFFAVNHIFFYITYITRDSNGRAKEVLIIFALSTWFQGRVRLGGGKKPS